LTNDGDLTKKLTHPSFNKKKIYQVFLDKNLLHSDIQKIAEGVKLEDGIAQVDAIAYTSTETKKEVGLEIHSGKNRIVRRIFEQLGYKVTKLDRVYFAGLTKKNLPRGRWRFLTEKEVKMLKMNAFE
jgi:23S rRNA pseudouridine2605 synthase